ncbi:MAG: DNA endonuclease SmrA [Aliidiomarina sp.]|uniref:DNA endonuclease SmrA n=1 Tax=Aliidiomarina sp. TaxID=1872439 RepID=UPI0025BAC969|nr:DNA endonuclease SmrA [Aliidiomarina sp.]MCH8502260.1 DNA endonuclease SmrA [Aliidiomarina sp.]
MSEIKSPDNDDEIALFQELMQDVKPLTKPDTVALERSCLTTEQQAARREAAMAAAEAEEAAALSEQVRDWVEPNDPIEWRLNGIQDGVFRQLKRGHYEPQATLNMHNMRVSEARIEISRFIKECYRTGVRTALIIHGIGLKSQPRPGLLKSLVNQWLPDIENVMAFHSAQKFHGGMGATYVMIRKNQSVKLATKEQNRKR